MADEEKVIRSLADSNKELTDSYEQLSGSLLRAASTSKAWTFVSRMTSGSGFWKIQNKIRAIADAYVVMDDNMKEQIKTQSEAAKTMEKLKKAQDKLPEFNKEKFGPQGFNLDEVKELPEFQNQLKLYTDAYDGDEDAATEALTGVMLEQLDANRELIGGLENQLIDQIKYQKMGPGAKFIFRASKMLKLISTVFKMLLRFLISASIGFVMLLLVIPLAVKAFKAIDKYIDMEDIKKVLRGVKKVITVIFDVIKAAFSGDYKELQRVLATKIFWPITTRISERLVSLGGRIKEALGNLKDKLISGFMNSGPVQLFIKLADAIMNSSLVKGVTGAVKGVRSFLGLSTGGTINRGGMAIVGENGPELVSLPSGATVHSNSQSKGMGNTIHVHVNGRVGASDAEIRDIAQKVAREINLQMNRTTSAVGRF